MSFLIRLLINAAALWVAVALIPNIEYAGTWAGLLVVSLIFGIVNALIRPILMLLTCPLVLLTLGLFIFVLNAFLLWLTGEIAQSVGIPFVVSGFGAALLGSIIITIVSTILTILTGPKEDRRRE